MLQFICHSKNGSCEFWLQLNLMLHKTNNFTILVGATLKTKISFHHKNKKANSLNHENKTI